MNEITTHCDGYKLGHHLQYPDLTQKVQTNCTARGSRVPGQDFIIFAGLQPFLMDEIAAWDDFFISDVDAVCQAFENRVNSYLGPNSVGSAHIRALHNLGFLPLEFRAVPEGTAVPIGVPMLLAENTVRKDDEAVFGWVVNYFETILSAAIWMPVTSATTAFRMRRILDQWAEITGSPKEFVGWQGHDFSFRGMPGIQAACMSGASHLMFFTGTDTIPAIPYIERFYGKGLPPDYLIGGSVSATEHSVMCAGGMENELDTFLRLITKIYPEGIVSVVSDTWNLWDVCLKILPALKDEILARLGKVVIRPDSGDPVKIVCGDPEAPEGSPERAGVIELLWDVFGGTETDKGHKVLDEHIGCIYGDSINDERCEAILRGLAAKGFASCNMVFGIGSYSYQYVTRDTYNMAMKATWCQVNGEGRDIYKDPVTDDGVKKSAKGRLAVLKHEDGTLYRVDQATPEQEDVSELIVVWRDGAFIRKESFDKIRERALANVTVS